MKYILITLIFTLIISGCGVQSIPNVKIKIPKTPTIPVGGQLKIRWYGPDHPEDFEKFGGIIGYHFHWSTSPKEAANTNILCGNILDDHGRPDDKYENRLSVLATDAGCASTLVNELETSHSELQMESLARECNFTFTGLPLNTKIYFVVNAYMGNSSNVATQWWGCPTKENTTTITSAL